MFNIEYLSVHVNLICKHCFLKKKLFIIFGFNGSSSLLHLSLLVLSGDYSLVVVHELLIVVTSLVHHKP